MSYLSAASVQTAVFALLSGDATLGGLVPGVVFDAPPPGTPQGTYVVPRPAPAPNIACWCRWSAMPRAS